MSDALSRYKLTAILLNKTSIAFSRRPIEGAKTLRRLFRWSSHSRGVNHHNKIIYNSFTSLVVSDLEWFAFSDFFRNDNLAGPRHEKKLDLFFFFPLASVKSISSFDDIKWSPSASTWSAFSSKTAGHSSLIEAPSGSRDVKGTLSCETRSRLHSELCSQGSREGNSSSGVDSSGSLMRERG